MTIRWKIFALACVILVAGCDTATTKNPVGTTTGLVADKALNGIWKDDMCPIAALFCGQNDMGEYLHIFQSGDSEMTALWVNAPVRSRERGDFTEYRFTTATLGNNHFMNVVEQPTNATEKPKAGFTPIFYTLRNNGHKLTIYHIDDNKVAKAIESGALTGHIEKHQDKDKDGKPEDVYDSIQITAEPAELDVFMAKPEAADLFIVYRVFKRIE